jgi:hypothetical protein
MDAAGFEALVRSELALRDKRRQGRLFCPANYAEADELFVAAVLEGAGYGPPADQGAALVRARTSRRRNTERALPEAV